MDDSKPRARESALGARLSWGPSPPSRGWAGRAGGGAEGPVGAGLAGRVRAGGAGLGPSPSAQRAHAPWAPAGRGAAGLSPAEPSGRLAMGDRERNKKRLLELLQAAGTGNALCADCGAAGKGAAARGARPRPPRPFPSFQVLSCPGPPARPRA